MERAQCESDMRGRPLHHCGHITRSELAEVV